MRRVPAMLVVYMFDIVEVAQQVEIMAFMKAKVFQPAGRGAKGRFVHSPGGRGQGAGARAMPPRARADMTCVICGRKGHAASECMEGWKERSERPCFTCSKPGHLARDCPQRPKGRADIRAIEGAPAKKVASFCLNEKPVTRRATRW